MQDVSDATELIIKLGLAPAHVVGNSAGSSIALKLAAQRPEIFRTLAVHDPPLFDLLSDEPSSRQIFLEMKRRIDTVKTVLERGDAQAAVRLFVETVAFGPGTWETLPPARKEIFVNNAMTHLEEMNDPKALNIDIEALSKFSQPVLLSVGEKSPLLFALVVEKLTKAIPSATMLTFPGAGHSPHISHPREFVEIVSSFAKTSLIA